MHRKPVILNGVLMKLNLDERMKHRIIGLAVIISVGVIIAPAFVKKTNQRFDEKSTIALKLPVRPIAKRIEVPNEQAMFNNKKIAHIEIPPVPSMNTSHSAATPKVVVLSELTNKNPANHAKAIRLAANDPLGHPHLIASKSNITLAKHSVAPASNLEKNKPHQHKLAAKKKKHIQVNKSYAMAYAVQLATFSEQSNAIALVNRLKKKGYDHAVYTTIRGKKTVYKVTVGHTTKRDKAVHLQHQLASAVQIKGFVIPTGIS